MHGRARQSTCARAAGRDGGGGRWACKTLEETDARCVVGCGGGGGGRGGRGKTDVPGETIKLAGMQEKEASKEARKQGKKRQ